MATTIYSPLKCKASKSLGATHIRYRITHYQNSMLLTAVLVNKISKDTEGQVYGLQVSIELSFPPINAFNHYFEEKILPTMHTELTSTYEGILKHEANEEFSEAEYRFTRYLIRTIRFMRKFYRHM